ncbi:hypothetical protein G9P44_003828 [Scheffersomyces stipitis]|nr:hypothetical protein G9P44_003828 [Scheffersomyces stipitis]
MVALTRSKSGPKVIPEVRKVLASFDDAMDAKETKVKVPRLKKTSSDLGTPSPKKSPKKIKIDYEDALHHIVVPDDYSLPKEFEEFHVAEFVKGLKHVIKQDKSLYRAVVRENFNSFARTTEPKKEGHELISSYWYALISSVIGQQISGHAARAVEKKFKDSFGDDEMNPENTLKKSFDELRAVGLSNMKTKYVISISEAFSDPKNKLTDPKFYEGPLEEIVEELVSLKGIGVWSAKMFAIFTLKEMDVFAEDDLGVARGMAKYVVRRPEVLEEVKRLASTDEQVKLLLKKKAKFAKKDSRRDWTPLHDEYVKLAALKYSPYRTALMMILWRIGSTNLDVFTN